MEKGGSKGRVSKSEAFVDDVSVVYSDECSSFSIHAEITLDED